MVDDKPKLTAGMFTSRTEEWATPDYVYKYLDNVFHFTLDPCCTTENNKCPKGFTIDNGFNGLKESWKNEVVFMNPPYGREIYLWMEKAYKEFIGGGVRLLFVWYIQELIQNGSTSLQ